MAFDADKFTAAAKQAGYSDEDIQSEIQRQTKNINAATGQEFGKAGETAVQGQAQQWRDQGSPMPGTKAPEDIRSLGGQLFDWASTPAGNAVLGGLGLAGAAAAGLGIKDRMKRPEAAPRVEPYVAPSYDFETTAREVPDRAGLPQPSTPAPQAATPAPIAPAPAPTGIPQPTPPVAMPGAQQPQMQYGETKINAPTGVPNPVAPPAEVAPAPVAPKPVSELEQLRIEKARFDLEAAKAKEARAAEAHANRLAADAKRAEAKAQTKTASGSISPEEQKMLQNSEKAKFDKAIAADQKAAAIAKAPAASVVPPVAPVTPAAPASPAPAATVTEGAAVAPKGPKWPGGAEGSAVQLFGGTKKNFTPESQAAVEMFKDFVGGPLTMPPTGGSINQIPEASKFYEKHTGQPLPRNAEGKLTRIPEEQMQKLHTGIRTELEDAVKGNKLGTLGKGAMAAAALLGLTGAVQAAQKGDFGPLRQAGFDIGGPVALGKLGIAALSRAAGTGFSAATYAGNLNEGEERELARRRHEFEKESQKLGSPLRSVPPPR